MCTTRRLSPRFMVRKLRRRIRGRRLFSTTTLHLTREPNCPDGWKRNPIKRYRSRRATEDISAKFRVELQMEATVGLFAVGRPHQFRIEKAIYAHSFPKWAFRGSVLWPLAKLLS
ncbi:hypothetical protein QR680_013408 [Steinernema hermaphroditum]|uniref:Uncharacterized protein n=1 Tax=Steinernema hermaphroditum TaxID=289476 RepID=A0AA39I878_9BILA|nr:hypothetical protein QR680_013408 [Steinernema hermaphroditum]